MFLEIQNLINLKYHCTNTVCNEIRNIKIKTKKLNDSEPLL